MFANVSITLFIMQRKSKIKSPNLQLKGECKMKEVGDALPYGGKIVMAKKKKPETWFMIILQAAVLSVGLWLLYFSYRYPDHLHFNIHWVAAHFGNSHAQHLVGHKYLTGHLVEQNNEHAIYWLQKAAAQGHPEACYNLAVAHLKGIPTRIKSEKEVEHLFKHAANQNLPHAEKAYSHWCAHKSCG